jgi:hypothetical protein
VRSWLLAALLLLASGAAYAAPPRGAIVTFFIDPGLTEVGLGEIQAAPTGKGVYINFVESDVSGGVTACFLDATTRIQQNPAAVTATFAYGSTALTSVLRVGEQTDAALTASALTGAMRLSNGAATRRVFKQPIYVPPGSFFTCSRQADDLEMTVVIGFTEVQ